jgi:hypothetical protein
MTAAGKAAQRLVRLAVDRSGHAWSPGDAPPCLSSKSQYTSIRYSERLGEIGSVRSVASPTARVLPSGLNAKGKAPSLGSSSVARGLRGRGHVPRADAADRGVNQARPPFSRTESSCL